MTLTAGRAAVLPGARRKTATRRFLPYLLVSPTFVIFLLFKGYPIVNSLWVSLTTGAGEARTFAGLDNYSRLWNDPLFWTALTNTLTIIAIEIPILLSLSLVLALGLNSFHVKLRSWWRLGAFMPVVTSLVSAGIIFGFLLNTDQGALNWFLSLFGVGKLDWLGDPVLAKLSVGFLIIWHYIGYFAVIFLAGLQGISKDLYEAAMVDGAGPLRRFWNVTLPALRPITLFAVVLATIYGLQLFDEPFVLTDGGPDNATLTVSLYLYNNGFKYFDFGYASAIAYVMVLLVVVLGVVQTRLGGRR